MSKGAARSLTLVTATNGFWASLNIATTERLPLLFEAGDHAPEALNHSVRWCSIALPVTLK